MTSDVTALSMAKWFALITYQALESDRLSGEEDQPGSALMMRKMEKVGPGQKLRFTGWDGDGGWPAGAGARARSAHENAGARGEGAAKARERGRW